MPKDRDSRMRQLEDAIERFLDTRSGGAPPPEPDDDEVRELLRPMLAGADEDGDAGPRSPATTDPAVTIDGLRVVRELGRGGMGVVYEADDPQLRRRVAVKLLRRSPDLPPSSIVRFRREAELAAALQHPAIVPIHGVGETDHAFYLVMELQRAATLAQVLDELRTAVGTGGPAELPAGSLDAAAARATALRFPPDRTRDGSGSGTGTAAAPQPDGYVREAATVAAAIAEALGHAHERGIVHRDVKPANILLAAATRARLGDFGLARSIAAPAVTHTGDAPGTPQYMAPEQARGRTHEVGPAADVFALGAVLHELLTLERAFAADSTAAVLLRVLHDDPPDAARRNRAVPADLQAIVHKALRKAPADRYPDGAALARDLRAFLRGEPVTARPLGRIGRIRRWAGREPWRAVAAALLLLGVPVIGWLVASNREHRDEAAVGEQVLLEQRIDRLLADGFSEAGEGDGNAARALFEQLVALAPEREEGIAGLSVVERRFDIERAIAVIRAHPEVRARSDALRRREQALLRLLGRDAEAARLDAGLPAKPAGFDAFLDGYRFVERGHYEHDDSAHAQAVALLHRAIVTSERAPRVCYYEWLHAAAHVKDGATIDAAIATVQRRWPEAAATSFWVAFAHDALGDTARAIEDLRRAVTIDPKYVAAVANLARLLRRAQILDEAVRTLEAGIGSSPDSSVLLRELAQTLYLMRRFEPAIDNYRRAAALAALDAEARRGFAAALVDGGHADEGGRLAEELLRANSRDSAAHYIRAMALVHAGDHTRARPHLLRHVELTPTVHGYFQLGLTCAALGDGAGARSAYTRVLELDPRHAQAATNLAIQHLNAGDPQRAAEFLRQALAADPDLMNARRAMIAALRGKPDELLAYLRDWTTARPQVAEAWSHLAKQLAAMAGADRARADEARAAIDHAFALGSPQDGPTLLVLGAVQRAGGDLVAARATLQRARSLLPAGDRFTPYYEQQIAAELAACDAAEGR